MPRNGGLKAVHHDQAMEMRALLGSPLPLLLQELQPHTLPPGKVLRVVQDVTELPCKTGQRLIPTLCHACRVS